MTSCSDDAPMLQLSSTQPSSLGRNDFSPSNYAQFQHKCLVKKAEMNNKSLANLQEFVNVGSISNPAANSVSVQQQCLSLINTIQNQQQQQAVGEAEVSLNKTYQPFVSTAQIIPEQEVNRIKEVLRQLAVDQPKVLANGVQSPWMNVTADGVTCHLKKIDANNWTGVSTDDEQNYSKSKMGTPWLGDLLPPPPRLPVAPQTLEIPRSLSTSFVNSRPFASNTTSSFVDLSPRLKHSESKYTSASHLSIQDTSSDDKNQPLDLSTSTKRQPVIYCETAKENNNATVPLRKPENGDVAPHSPTDNSLMLTNGSLPSSKRLPVYSKNSDSSPPVHTWTSAYPQNISLLQSMIEINENKATTNVANLQKWLMAAQQHQQVTTMQQQQPLRKRSASTGHGNRQGGEHSMLDQHNRPPKTMLLNSGIRVSSEKNTELSNHSKMPAVMLNNANSGKRYKRYAKPPYSYVSLITLSILSSAEKKLRLSQILKRISDMFPFFKGSYQGWRDSVRHNLSQNECFVKVLKNPYRPTAKGNYWTVNVAIIPHELLLRQNTLVSRYIQESGFTYRKDLTEVFDILSGNIKIPVPEHLIKGDSLIDQPASVMEVLLLEPKREDDLGSLSSIKNSKVYCLGDMFAKDDYVNSDLTRHHPQPMLRNTWPEKVTSPKVTTVASKPESHRQATCPSSPYPSFGTNVELQKLAFHMIQNSQGSFNSANNNQLQTQKELLAQAFSTLNYLPLLQNFYQANASQQHHSGKTTAQQRTSKLIEKSENGNITENSVQDNLTVIEISDSSSAKTSPGNNWNDKVKSEDDNDATSIKSTSPKDINMIDSDLLDTISLPHTPNRPVVSNEPDAKSRTSNNGRHSPISSSSTDLSAEALFQPSMNGDAAATPPNHDILFTNFNSRSVGLAKTV